MDDLFVERLVAADSSVAFGQFWDFVAMSAFWEPIEHVNVHYDDGLCQDATMAVIRDGAEENIRIVRFRAGESIEFFNPQPPPMMSLHRGAWRFFQAGAGSCRVVAERSYCLLRAAGETSQEYARRREQFVERLRDRLALLLRRFANGVEQ